MRLGVCTSLADASLLKQAGWDYVEENVQNYLRGEENEWNGDAAAQSAPLKPEAACLLVPAKLKLVGPVIDLPAIRTYMANVMERAEKVGMRTIVFGSGKARQVPESFSRETARMQILDFVRMAVELAGRHGVVLVLEHLCARECNIINSVAEAMEYVKAVGHPSFRCLVDSYHFWEQKEPLDSLSPAMPWIGHVHLADVSTRLPPGQSGPEKEKAYLDFFRVLKAGGYDGRISVEPRTWEPPMAQDAARVAQRIRTWWAKA